MEIGIFIVGLLLCSLSTGVLIYFKLNRNGFNNVLTKILASSCFVIFAVLLSSSKSNISYYGTYAISFLIIGLICGLVGDILLEFKGFYPFHEKKYFKSGFSIFCVGHLCFLIFLILFANSQIDIFNLYFILPFFLLLILSVIITISLYFIELKYYKYNFNSPVLINLYTIQLVFTFLLSFYLSISLNSLILFLISIGFFLHVLSFFVLINYYFANTNKSNSLVFSYTLLYYIAQIIVAGFIFFI